MNRFLVLISILTCMGSCELAPVYVFHNNYTMELYLSDSGYQTNNYSLRCLSPKDTFLNQMILLDAYEKECVYQLNLGSHFDTFAITYDCVINNQSPNQVKFYNLNLKSNRINDFEFYDINKNWSNKLLKINYR